MKKLFTFALLCIVTMGGIYAQSGFRYPYVMADTEGDKSVIVSRDDLGGVQADYVRSLDTPWSETEKHTEKDEANKVAAMLQVIGLDDGYVRKAVTWTEATKFCNDLGEEWRVPTQRELMLIYVMNGELDEGHRLMTSVSDIPVGVTVPETMKTDGIFYWSMTYDSTAGENDAWSMCFSADLPEKDGQVKSSQTTYTNFVRCVRDYTEGKNK